MSELQSNNEGDLGKNQPEVFNKIWKSPRAKRGWFKIFVKNRRLIFSQNHPKNMWLLVNHMEQSTPNQFSTNAMSSYTENDLLFVPVDFITFRLISSFRLISREKPDVYKETSGWFHTTMWLLLESWEFKPCSKKW